MRLLPIRDVRIGRRGGRRGIHLEVRVRERRRHRLRGGRDEAPRPLGIGEAQLAALDAQLRDAIRDRVERDGARAALDEPRLVLPRLGRRKLRAPGPPFGDERVARRADERQRVAEVQKARVHLDAPRRVARRVGGAQRDRLRARLTHDAVAAQHDRRRSGVVRHEDGVRRERHRRRGARRGRRGSPPLLVEPVGNGHPLRRREVVREEERLADVFAARAVAAAVPVGRAEDHVHGLAVHLRQRRPGRRRQLHVAVVVEAHRAERSPQGLHLHHVQGLHRIGGGERVDLPAVQVRARCEDRLVLAVVVRPDPALALEVRLLRRRALPEDVAPGCRPAVDDEHVAQPLDVRLRAVRLHPVQEAAAAIAPAVDARPVEVGLGKRERREPFVRERDGARVEVGARRASGPRLAHVEPCGDLVLRPHPQLHVRPGVHPERRAVHDLLRLHVGGGGGRLRRREGDRALAHVDVHGRMLGERARLEGQRARAALFEDGAVRQAHGLHLHGVFRVGEDVRLAHAKHNLVRPGGGPHGERARRQRSPPPRLSVCSAHCSPPR